MIFSENNMTIKPTPIDADLLELMRDIYSKYTGYQVAECIKVIRMEITQQKEEQALDRKSVV